MGQVRTFETIEGESCSPETLRGKKLFFTNGVFDLASRGSCALFARSSIFRGRFSDQE